MAMIEIHADMREQRSGLVDLLKKRGDVNVLDLALPIGDFSVGGGIIIERKTAVDFINSIMDGRLHEQVIKMKLNYTHPTIIVESDIYSTRSKFSLESLGGMYAWILAQGVRVVPAPGIPATAEIIYFMAKNAQVEMKDVPMRAKKPAITELSARFILEGLPGVGPAQAKKLLEHFGSVRGVMNASIEELSMVSRIGKATAERIHEVTGWGL